VEQDNDEAMNNLGVLYTYKRKLDSAEKYQKLSGERGNKI